MSWKWLSLRHPRHPDGAATGYLRVSLAVARAGEAVPVSTRNPPATHPDVPLGGGSPFLSIPPPIKEQEEPPEDEDVEANLLRPPPCTATLQLRVYCAEDLPQGGCWGGMG